MRAFVSALFALAVTASAAASAPMPHAMHGTAMHVTKHIALPGDGGWDYLSTDAEARRLYVTHNQRVQVVSLDDDTLIGEVSGLNGAHGVAVAPALGRGFITSGRDSAVVVFDTRTFATLQRLPVGARFPDAILFEPVTQRVFSFNGGNANATIFDAATGALLGTIALGGKPEAAVADGHGMVFVNNEDSSRVVAFDAATLEIQHEWPLSPGETPSGLAYDPEKKRLFAVCENKLMVVLDATNGHVLQTLPIGEGCDGVVFDPGADRAYASNGDGTMTVVGENKGRYEVVQNVTTRPGARTIALDPKRHRVYTASPRFGPRPAPDAEHPHPRPPILPGTFEVVVVGN